MDSLISKLTRAGLTTTEAELYNFIYKNPGCCIADSCLKLKQSKSSIYRAFEGLKLNGLINSNNNNWKQSIEIDSFTVLINELENRKRRDNYLINYFKSLNIGHSFNIKEGSDYIELLNEEETYQKYLDLSEMEWSSMLAFGNWEDLNNEDRNMVPVEKKFVSNRIKNGGKAFVAVTKPGPYTNQITDYGSNQDKEEGRKAIKSKLPFFTPFWANAFEGNNYVHLWSQKDNGDLQSTLINSPSVATFYKNLIYSNVV